MPHTPMDVAEIVTSWSGGLPGSPGAWAGRAEHVSTLSRLFSIAMSKLRANRVLPSHGGNGQDLREREGSWTRHPDLATAAALWLSVDTHFQGLFFLNLQLLKFGQSTEAGITAQFLFCLSALSDKRAGGIVLKVIPEHLSLASR